MGVASPAVLVAHGLFLKILTILIQSSNKYIMILCEARIKTGYQRPSTNSDGALKGYTQLCWVPKDPVVSRGEYKMPWLLHIPGMHLPL